MRWGEGGWAVYWAFLMSKQTLDFLKKNLFQTGKDISVSLVHIGETIYSQEGALEPR